MKKLMLGVIWVAANAWLLAAPPAPIPLWPGAGPGETKLLPVEADTTSPTGQLIAGGRVIRLGNVSVPTITIYRPDPLKDTGAAIIVCPGGGYFILAMDLEGTEVCAWLNSIGVTGVLLKYRVPGRAGQERHAAALQDAQRAVGLVRHQAKEIGIDPTRIGILGFSAGAHLSAALAANHAQRHYPVVDEADAVSCRPDFTVLIYPGGFMLGDRLDVLRPEVGPVKGVTPPSFIAMAQDDPVHVEHAVAYYLALRKAGISAELHLYPTGGHGYGLRRTADDVTTWPDRAADWLKTGGWLKWQKRSSGRVKQKADRPAQVCLGNGTRVTLVGEFFGLLDPLAAKLQFAVYDEQGSDLIGGGVFQAIIGHLRPTDDHPAGIEADHGRDRGGGVGGLKDRLGGLAPVNPSLRLGAVRLDRRDFVGLADQLDDGGGFHAFL